MRNVLVRVELVRHRQLRKFRQPGRDDFCRRPFTREQLSADFRKLQVRLAGDGVVGELHNWLLLDFITHLRSAENDRDVRTQPFERGHHTRRRRDIPDVDAEADDFWIPRQQRFRDVERPLVDVKFRQARTRPQWAEIREQVPQSERGVNVLRVQRGQHNLRREIGSASHVGKIAGHRIHCPPCYADQGVARSKSILD